MNDTRSKKGSSIPTSSLGRAARLLGTGMQLGGNYLSHLTRRATTAENSTLRLHEANAATIYQGLSQLKGSALKVLQMLSLDTGILPEPYRDRFQLSQSSVPPLSFPLVVRVFQQTLGKSPSDIFDTFSHTAVAAASMGQVHRATKGDHMYAVKIQYPGVAASIDADLSMIRPFASLLFQIKDSDVAFFLEEVRDRLKEEVDYMLELSRGEEIAAASSHLEGITFPRYYRELSGQRVITMDWMEGMHLPAFLATNPSREICNRAGQRIWDFYHFQIHTLRLAHADPHPGNFLFQPDGDVCVIDFGCVKQIPSPFYDHYFSLIKKEIREDDVRLARLFDQMGILLPDDTPQERDLFFSITAEFIELLARPFDTPVFDFSDASYFNQIAQRGEEIARMKEVRESRSARGPRDAIFVNRIYVGLYTLLHSLGAEVATRELRNVD